MLRSHGQIDLGVMTPASLGHCVVGSKSREPEIKAPIAHHVFSADPSPPVTCISKLSTWSVPDRRSLRDCVCLFFFFVAPGIVRACKQAAYALDAHYYRSTAPIAPSHHRATLGYFSIWQKLAVCVRHVAMTKPQPQSNTLGRPKVGLNSRQRQRMKNFV